MEFFSTKNCDFHILQQFYLEKYAHYYYYYFPEEVLLDAQGTKVLTAMRMYWIQFVILPSSASHCIFCKSSLLSFSTPSFRKLCSNVGARTSLRQPTHNKTILG
jgi:hypothetical protein